MKKINVSKKCVACGACILMTDLLEENSEGKVNPVSSGKITDAKAEEFMEVIKSCPVNAITVKNENLVKSSGKDGLLELKNLIQQKLVNYQIPSPSRDSYRCDINQSSISYNSPSGNCRYDYSSDNRAESAGLNEFDRVMYSQRKALIQEYLVDYKNRQLKRYAFYERKKGNYYYDIDQELSKLISQIADEIVEKTGNKAEFPENFYQMEIGPDYGYKGEDYAYQLRHLEMVYTDTIANKLESLSSYRLYVNTDDMEDYRGKDTYCYNLNEVMDEFRRDLAAEIKDTLNDDSGVSWCIKESLGKYKECLTGELNKKVKLLIKEIERFC